MKNTKMNIYQITIMALMAALTCILAPNSLPIGLVPITLTNLVIYFSVYILGFYYGMGSYLIYLLLGIVGLPVFSGYEGGIQKLAGPTGGYIIGFIFMIIIGGLAMEISRRNMVVTIIAWIIGTFVAYAFGTIWFVKVTKMTVQGALSLCVYPFILPDIAKVVLGTFLGKAVYTALKKAGLLQALQKVK